MTGSMYSTVPSYTYAEGRITPGSTPLILEMPLEITINGALSTLIMFTPGMARELVTGFLFTEGLVESPGDIEFCKISTVTNDDGGQTAEASLTLKSRRPPPSVSARPRVSFSSCSIRGKEHYVDLERGLGRVRTPHRFSMEMLRRLPRSMSQSQPLYRKTGGAHAAFLFDAQGALLVSAEDLGRHNALDKVIGACLLRGLPCEDKVLVSSGRASLEMILKTARAGIPLFIANSRPTARAVDAADSYGITLLDMARGSNRIYSHVRRIQGF